MKTLHFENDNQDVLEMDISSKNTVIQSRPINPKLLVGSHINPDSMRKGAYPHIIGLGNFKHLITKIEEVKDPTIITDHNEEIPL